MEFVTSHIMVNSWISSYLKHSARPRALLLMSPSSRCSKENLQTLEQTPIRKLHLHILRQSNRGISLQATQVVPHKSKPQKDQLDPFENLISSRPLGP
jgi:hypothetical protein